MLGKQLYPNLIAAAATADGPARRTTCSKFFNPKLGKKRGFNLIEFNTQMNQLFPERLFK